MIPFPSINQFRNVVSGVRQRASFMGLDAVGEPTYNHAAKFPTLTFRGTVKLHGTNAAIVFNPDGSITFQSRERELTHVSDNAGFFAHMDQRAVALTDLEARIKVQLGLTGLNTIAVYGEWCGGNIQKGVAITGLPKMFVMFALRINDDWVDIEGLKGDAQANIFNICEYDSYHIEIDFEQPEHAQNQLGQLTLAVEECCPVGLAFGATGVGEGIVWRCVTDPSSDLWFKVKGEKHSASKVKTLAPADVETAENTRDFIAKTVTEARLEQGLQNLVREQLKPFDMTSIGDFIRWVHGDVLKEEADTLAASGLEAKKLGGPIAQVAKRWYVTRLDAEQLAAVKN